MCLQVLESLRYIGWDSNEFLNDVKDMLHDKGWPTQTSAYTISKAAMNASPHFYHLQLVSLCWLEEVEDKVGESLPKAHDANKLCKPNRRRPARAMGSSTACQQREPNGDLFEIEDAKFPVGWHEGGLAPSNSPIKKEEGDESWVEKHEARGSQRSSVGRPLLRAAEKVQSYKEAPLNTKMRRFE
ncbi:hypothetical protein AAG906_038122 [Vitis piasezkii]